MKKRGLKEFQQVYDTAFEMMWLALDLSQNLDFKKNFAKPEYSKIEDEDIHMATALSGGGRKYNFNLAEQIHNLAKALGFTREDYIEGSEKRKGNCNVYIVGKGSITCKAEDLKL